MTKIVIISPDTLPLPLTSDAPEFIEENGNKYSMKDKCSRVTGLGNRAWKITENLATNTDFDVTVLVPDLNYPGKQYIDTTGLNFKIETYSYKAALWNWSQELDRRLKHCDFVIIQTATGVGFKNCSVLPGNVNVIVDGFVPLYTELPCTILSQSTIFKKILWNTFTDHYTGLLLRANCVLYANDRQSYHYEGQFHAIGKLDWSSFTFSPLLKIPYGIDKVEMVKRTEDEHTFRLLWLGPVYPWYKPEKILDVVPHLKNTTIDFIGVRHPRYTNAYNNFFKKFFEPHQDTHNIIIKEDFHTTDLDTPGEIYKEYDAGIVLARDWLEERYASRSRILDMISYGLPVLTNNTNSFFNELNFLNDSLYGITSKTLRKDLTKLEEDKSRLRVSQTSHKILQQRLSWSVIVKDLEEYIRRFSHANG